MLSLGVMHPHGQLLPGEQGAPEAQAPLSQAPPTRATPALNTGSKRTLRFFFFKYQRTLGTIQYFPKQVIFLKHQFTTQNSEVLKMQER